MFLVIKSYSFFVKYKLNHFHISVSLKCHIKSIDIAREKDGRQNARFGQNTSSGFDKNKIHQILIIN